jgi:hypothetical protein
MEKAEAEIAELREALAQAIELIEAKPTQTQRIIPRSELAAALAAGARLVKKVDDDTFVIEGGEQRVVIKKA